MKNEKSEKIYIGFISIGSIYYELYYRKKISLYAKYNFFLFELTFSIHSKFFTKMVPTFQVQNWRT